MGSYESHHATSRHGCLTFDEVTSKDLAAVDGTPPSQNLLAPSAGWAAGRLGWTAADNSDWLFAPRAAIITVFFVLGAAVIAPVLEELFFRGFMMGALNRSVHLAGRVRTVVAVVVSSLVFGALHTSGLDSAVLYLLVATATAGAVLAVLAVRRGNLGASMVTHVVFNTTGVLCAWLVTL